MTRKVDREKIEVKDNNSSHDDMKKNLSFKQLRLNYINNSNNSNNENLKKGHLRLVINSIKVDVVPKTDNEIYVVSTIKIYSYFSFVFSTAPKKDKLLKISEVMWLL